MLLKVPACLCLLVGTVLSAGLSTEETCGTQNADSDFTPGTNAGLREFPWMARLRYRSQSTHDAEFMCTGSLISSRHILTSARCTKPRDAVLEGVRLGEYDLTTDVDCVNQDAPDCAPPPQDFEIDKVVVHEDYIDRSSDNDIALLKLDRDATLTDFVRPLCIPPHKLNPNPGDVVLSSGWGQRLTGELVTIKKKVVSSIVTNEDCSHDYVNSRKSVLENHICTKAYQNNTAFTCMGDSGGPIMLLKDNRWYQIGIVSFGKGCGYQWADVNTKVDNYLVWITKTLKTM